LNKYISIPSSDCLQKLIDYLHDLTGWHNICGAIDGTHIPLASFPNKRVILAANDFFNRKKINSIVM
jgi:hypothetical protein